MAWRRKSSTLRTWPAASASRACEVAGAPGALHHVEQWEIERGVVEIELEVEIRRLLTVRGEAGLEVDRSVEPWRQIESQRVPSLGVEPALEHDGPPAPRGARDHLAPAQLGRRPPDAHTAGHDHLATVEIELETRRRDGAPAEGTAHRDAAEIAIRTHGEWRAVGAGLHWNHRLHPGGEAARDLARSERKICGAVRGKLLEQCERARERPAHHRVDADPGCTAAGGLRRHRRSHDLDALDLTARDAQLPATVRGEDGRARDRGRRGHSFEPAHGLAVEPDLAVDRAQREPRSARAVQAARQRRAQRTDPARRRRSS